MAGQPADPLEAPKEKLKLVGKGKDGDFGAEVELVQGESSDWLESVDEAAAELAKTFGTDGHSAPIESMIATLGDPIDTGLGYEFDTHLRALRRGFEHPLGAAAFYRDRSWLPWDDREIDSDRRRDSEECRFSTPGIVLFRSDNPKGAKIYALLLAGESPTTGLRQAQMQTALDVQARLALHSGEKFPGPRPVRILGPAFSASAQSLRFALAKWAARSSSAAEFQVLTGTATGSAVPDWLGGGNSSLPKGSAIRFASTVVSEATAQCSYLWFLNRRLHVPPEDGFNEELDGSKSGIALAGVASLSESGTEFGATVADPELLKNSGDSESQTPSLQTQNPPCRFTTSATFHFPFHISALRDAYETLDRRENQARKDVAIARATSLDASLHEAKAPLDIEANPSDKTRAAQDIALGGLIERISTRRIRHVAIHATDVGDAIFLARRIRDLAPDVRIAFFGSDALLLHPDFRREVLGSLVVSSYPFLGLSEFDGGARGAFESFENANAQGVYNAVLAQRGARPELLSEYMLGSKAPLPVWISTIGRGKLLPTQVRTTFDCANTLYRGDPLARAQDRDLADYCKASWALLAAKDPVKVAQANATRSAKYGAYIGRQTDRLRLQPNAIRPRLWDFLFAVILFGFVLDIAHQNRLARRFAKDEFPDEFEPANDQQFDRAIARTKGRLYATIRSFLFLLAFCYMGTLYSLDFLARRDFAAAGGTVGSLSTFWDAFLLVIWSSAVMGSIVVSGVATLYSARRFMKNYGAFRRCVFSVAASPRNSVPDWLGTAFGVRKPLERHEVAHTSFSQVRFLALATLAIAIGFFCLLIGDTLNSTEWLDSRSVAPFARMTITTLRDMELTSGVSPSAPALLCMLCVYVWAVGRMQRLALAHSISRASPPDNETDLVSTPIRLILYPKRTSSDGEDAGFTKVERDLADAIWRPITGTVCVVAALGLAFFPLVLFALKPFSTLEGPLGSALLGAGLTLSVFLVGVTLVQEVQYWFSLERLLKRTLEHPLGGAFRSVPPFARDSLDHQVSRSPDELLRWSSCARQFHDLTRSLDTTGDFELLAGEKPALGAIAANLCRARTAALAGRDLGEVRAPDASEGAGTSELDDADASVSARDRSSLDAPESADVVPLSFPMRREEEAAQGRDEELRATLQALLAQEVIAAASRITELLERAWSARAVLQDELSEPREARISGQVEVSFAALAVAGVAGSRQLAPSGERDSLPPRAVATVIGSSIPPSAPRARSAAPRPERSTNGERHADALTPLEDSYSAAQLTWLRSAQTFVATVVTLIVHSHVRQFRHFVAVTTLCALLLLLAVCSYPFEPHRLMLTLIWVIVLSVAGAGLWIFIQMDRNTLISHVSGTSPDEVTFDASLLLRVFAWTIVPLLGVAAAQYPDFANVLFRIVSPFARALH